MADLKYSRQREAILSFLGTRSDHPTAEVVYENVRKEYPAISLGTVYRNLNLLKDLGLIQTLETGDGKVHFDWNAKAHNHFVCRTCGAVLDIAFETPRGMAQAAAKKFDGIIDGSAIQFFGVCGNCRKLADK